MIRAMQRTTDTRVFHQLPSNASGFTLVELLVIVAVIVILTSVGVFSLGQSTQSGRDLERQTNLREMATVLETYKRREGQYPIGSNGTNQWSGQEGSGHFAGGSSECQGSLELNVDAYICGLIPDYRTVLPVDDFVPGEGGYMYITNNEQTAFKLVAYNAIESGDAITPACPEYCNCDADSNSMAVWGGFAEGDTQSESDFACEMP